MVPPGQPYIQSELKLDYGAKLTPIGKWKKPGFHPYDGGIYIYKDQLTFVRYFSVNKKVKKGEKVSVGLYYQTCDVHQCYPPKEKLKTLKLSY